MKDNKIKTGISKNEAYKRSGFKLRDYRREKIEEALRIIRTELIKPEHLRNVNQFDHAIYLLNIYLSQTELPDFPLLYYDRAVESEYLLFRLLNYVECKLSKPENEIAKYKLAKKEKSKQNMDPEEDIDGPEIEEAFSLSRDALEVLEYLSVSEITTYVSRVMAGDGDKDRLYKMISTVFRVIHDTKGPGIDVFSNPAFVKRFWLSLNAIKRKWLIKNGYLDCDIVEKHLKVCL